MDPDCRNIDTPDLIESFLRDHIFLHDATIDQISCYGDIRQCMVTFSSLYRFVEGRFISERVVASFLMTECSISADAALDEYTGYDVVSAAYSANSLKLTTIVGDVSFSYERLAIKVRDEK